jgi:hypothetical protein
VPVTGIARGVVWTFGVAEAVEVGLPVAVAVAVAVGLAVAVAVEVGVAVEQRVKSVVHEAPSEGQQNCLLPHLAIVPTLSRLEQLISTGVPSAFDGLQLLSKSACPLTGHAEASGQIAPEAFS